MTVSTISTELLIFLQPNLIRWYTIISCKKLQVHKLCDPRVKNNLQVMLEERLHCVTAAEPEKQWEHIKTILHETSAEVVGLSTRKRQDWFDEADKEIQELLEKKHSCNNCLLAKPDDQAAKAAYKTVCRS